MRRLLHISDVHFGPPHRPEVSDAVVALAEERQPDLVVVSGDLTQRAKPSQFRDARAFVDRFSAPTITVPGNHDVPLWRVWERVFVPFGVYRRHFADTLEPVFRDDRMLVVGINTAFNWTFTGGRITRLRLRQVAEVLAQAPAALIKVVVAHHHLIPPPRFGTQRVTRNAHRAVDLFSGAGVDLILSGHQHQSFVANTEEFYPSGRPPAMILHSGTTTSTRGRGPERGRNTCYWIEVTSELIRVSLLHWDERTKRFAEHSRSLFPRHQRQHHSLEGLELGSFDSAV